MVYRAKTFSRLVLYLALRVIASPKALESINNSGERLPAPSPAPRALFAHAKCGKVRRVGMYQLEKGFSTRLD
jgi:hypothetical protein